MPDLYIQAYMYASSGDGSKDNYQGAGECSLPHI
jgi:hypothetical protein